MKALIGQINHFKAKNIDDRISFFSEADYKIKGFRQVVHDEPDVNFILDESFLNGISKLAKEDLTYDILVFPTHFRSYIEIYQNFPNQKFVIDHIAKPYIKKGEIEIWKSHLRSFCELDNA